MKKLAELLQERASKITAQKKMIDTRKAEKRDFTEEEATAFRALNTDIEGLDKKIEDRKAEDEAEKRAASLAGAPVTDGEEKEKEKVQERFSILKALRNADPRNAKGLDGAEKEMHEIGLAENRNAKVGSGDAPSLSIPLSYFSRATAQTKTEDSGSYGGALVQNQAPQMVAPLRPKLAFEELGASFMTGLSGGDIPLVVDNDFAMTFLAETTAITPQKKTYAGPTLAPKRAGGAVDISNQLLLQTSVDVENRIIAGLKNGFAQLLHTAIINGAGGVAPTGLLTYSGINDAAATAAQASSWARIVELMALIEEDNATEESLGFLLSPTLKAALKQVKKDAGSGRFLLENNMIDGYKTISTSLVPALDDDGTAVYPLIYGDFKQMVIGQWGSVNVTINPYSADLSNSVRLVLNTYADMKIANPAAFARNLFLTNAVS